jgi:hypothetical protein
LLLDNDLHRAPDLPAGHSVRPNQFGPTIGTEEINLGLTVTEDMHVSRLVIVDEDDHAKTAGTKHGDHRVI